MTEEDALTPRAERVVDFYGDPIVVALVKEGDAYVPVRTIAEFLGLDWSSQYKRIQRDEVLIERAHMVIMTGTDGRPRPMFSLPLDLLPGWLFGITATRVRPELAPKLKRYRQECFRVLWHTFEPEVVPHASPSGAANAPLVHVRELALAIAQMAEQQLTLEGTVTEIRTEVDHVVEQQQIVHTRMDRAAGVIKALEQRLGDVEDRVEPAGYITEEQAADVSLAVKGVAQWLTDQDPGKNHYQSVFGELYRRFRVASYKRIRQDQFVAVMRFLEEWQNTTSSAGDVRT
ncbi:MAG: ORF6C domain-containing protein [Herpetosiphonaceae bacterium]|nr:ORF6C domain-containing protein [Herpetosiphonaceae bacterium]